MRPTTTSDGAIHSFPGRKDMNQYWIVQRSITVRRITLESSPLNASSMRSLPGERTCTIPTLEEIDVSCGDGLWIKKSMPLSTPKPKGVRIDRTTNSRVGVA